MAANGVRRQGSGRHFTGLAVRCALLRNSARGPIRSLDEPSGDDAGEDRLAVLADAGPRLDKVLEQREA